MKRILLSIMTVAFALTGMAQEALFAGTQIESPVVNGDGSVTINVFAPKAVKVEVTGDFLPMAKVETPYGVQETQGSAELKEGKNGVWSFTSQPLAPELYSYSLTVDGMRMLDPSNAYVNRDIATFTNIFIVSKDKGDKGDFYKVNEVAHGNVAKVWYDSPTLKMKRRMTVYTPAGYEKGGRYPVLYLLHGAGGDEDAWTTLGRTAQIIDNLVAQGKAKPMIVVMPNGNPNCQAAPGEWSRGMYKPSFMGHQDGKAEATMDESFKDIVSFIDANYRTQKNRNGRAVCGLSMGGGHTFHIAMRYPETFNYYGLFSAGLHLDGNIDPQAPFYEQLMANKDAQAKLQKLFNSRPKLYWIAIGKTDFLYKSNTDLRRYLDEQGYKYEYRETDGGHIWRNWRIYLTEFAQKIFK